MIVIVEEEPSALRSDVEHWRRRAELWRASAAVLKLAAWQRDFVANVTDWSEEARELFGIVDADAAPDAFLRVVHPDDRDELQRVLRAMLEGYSEKTATYRHRIIRRGGEVRWLETRLQVQRDGMGRPARLVCVSVDRTDTVTSEQARREAALDSAWLEHSSDAVFIADHDGRYVDVNDSACDLLGYAREELLAKTVRDLLDADEVRDDPPRYATIAAGQTYRRDRRLRHKNGSFVYTELTVGKLPDGRVRAIARDVTRRVAAERALQESEATLRELGANLPALLWVREVGGERVIYANDAWTPVLGKRPVIGEHYWQLVEPVHKDDLPRLVVDPPAGDEQERDQVVRFVLPGGEIAWYRVCKFGIRDAEGRPHRVAGFAMDVTHERSAEEKVRASLREKETLLREIHHRVKNNLQVVSSLLYLQASGANDAALSALLRQSQSRVSSMALVHEMLHHHSSDLSRVPFARYVRALGASLACTYGVTAENITFHVDAGDLALPIDAAVPCGLILNEMLSNSLKHAYPSGGRGTIRVALHLHDAQRFTLNVSDDGAGLPVDFEVRRRSSLGSKLIDSLVEQIGGTMTRNSSERGTHYEILFRAPLDDSRPPRG